MNNLERYNCLMRTIDKWVDKTTHTQGEPFKNLQDGSLVRRFVSSPGFSVRVEGLKTFFATDILDIFPRNDASRVTWQDIGRFLAGERRKKHCFNFEELEKCFSPEENREAARRTQLMADNNELTENMEAWEEIPVYLLEKLQEKFRRKLGEYWHICNMKVDQSKLCEDQDVTWKSQKTHEPSKNDQDEESGKADKEPGEEKEQKDEADELRTDKYKKCLMTLALHEIFVRKIMENRNTLADEYERHNEMMGNITEEMEEVIQQYNKADEEEKKKLAEQAEVRTQNEMENIRWVEKFWILQLLCLEHSISLGAEIQIVMLMEKKRLEEIKGKKRGRQRKVEEFLRVMKDRYLTGTENYNKNKNKYYRQLEAGVEDIFIRFLNSIPWSARRDITGAIETYLGIVEKGKLNAEQRGKLWYVQSIIACPLMDVEGKL